MGSSLLTRTLVSLALLPVAAVVFYLGGAVYAAAWILVIGLAGFEYARMFRAGGYQPADVVVIAGIAVLVAGRAWDGFESAAWIASLVILVAMTYHLTAYERGRDQAGTDFGITLGGLFYLGWLGAYLISLRNLPDGLWWVWTALPVVWLADSGAYLVGSRIGRHKMLPRLSPKKSWEGYIGGIVFGLVSGAVLPIAWQYLAGAPIAVTPLRGALLGLALGILTILGDLGESMFKRQAGLKDSGNILPGHGGAFDRIDSWLWAAVLSYYMIVWLFR